MCLCCLFRPLRALLLVFSAFICWVRSMWSNGFLCFNRFLSLSASGCSALSVSGTGRLLPLAVDCLFSLALLPQYLAYFPLTFGLLPALPFAVLLGCPAQALLLYLFSHRPLAPSPALVPVPLSAVASSPFGPWTRLGPFPVAPALVVASVFHLALVPWRSLCFLLPRAGPGLGPLPVPLGSLAWTSSFPRLSQRKFTVR